MKKIVLTGGPCSGKTTIIEELSQRGYSVLKETAKEIIEKRKHIPISKEESFIRQDLIFKTQLMKEEKIEKENYNLLFLDRSLIDGLGYSLFYCGEDSIKDYLPFVQKMKYDAIFLLELLPFNSEGFRPENEEEARNISDSISNLYKRLGYNLINVPVMSLEKRIDFILEQI